MTTPSAGPPEGAAASSPPGVFVTGTGTEVGKTIVASVIARTAAAGNRRVRVFKPAVTGLGDRPQPEIDPADWAGAAELPDHLLLRLAAASGQTEDEVAPHRYAPAASPHLAAQLSGSPIDPSRLLAAAQEAREGAELFVCEGVGGFLVPLAGDYLVRDFARELALPVVIAAPPGLGTINHTLLTLEAVRAADLEVLSVVLTPWPGTPGELEYSNLETISALGAVGVQTLPPLEVSEPESWPGLEPAVPAEPPE